MKKIIIVLFLQWISIGISGQVAISGFIKDANSKEPLVDANIYDLTFQNGTTSNHVGYFILKTEESAKLTISFVGYESQIIEITTQKDTVYNIELSPISIEAIEIVAKREDNFETPAGQVNINLKELESIPHLLGEKDILKALQSLPGISNSVEGTSGLIVRGGSVDQNLILFDEATIYNPNHFLGFVSVVNSDALKNVKVYKGGFPARYGGRISSVIDLTMKEGDKKQHHQKFNIGLISSKLFFEGPVKKEKSAYLLTARSSYLGLLLLPQRMRFNRGNSENYFNYWLYDLNGKVSFDLKHNAKLQFSYYRSFDHWKAVEGSKNSATKGILTWGNNLAALRYTRPVGGRVFTNFLLSYSAFRLNTALNSQDIEIDLSSAINDLSFKGYLSTSFTKNYDFYFGVQSIFHHFTPVGIKSSLNQLNTRTTQNAFESSLFIENKISIGSRMKLNGGLRYAVYKVNNTVFASPEPRLSIQYKLNEKTSLEMAYAQMKQFVHLLSNGSSGLPNDVWVPATEKAPPESAEQISIALENSMEKYDWSVELYYKRLKNLISYNSGGSFLFSFENSWEDLIETSGTGRGYGMEFFIKKSKGNWNGWLGYSLTWNERRFQAFNKGNWFPFKYDRRHEVEWTGHYTFGKSNNKQLAVSWIYQSGIAITTPKAYYLNSDEELVPLYTEKNNSRSPDYHRMDITYSSSKESSKGHRITWSFGIYNLYNRKNPFFISFGNYPAFQTPNDFQTPVVGQTNFVEQGSFLPLLPFVSYEVKFK